MCRSFAYRWNFFMRSVINHREYKLLCELTNVFKFYLNATLCNDYQKALKLISMIFLHKYNCTYRWLQGSWTKYFWSQNLIVLYRWLQWSRTKYFWISEVFNPNTLKVVWCIPAIFINRHRRHGSVGRLGSFR